MGITWTEVFTVAAIILIIGGIGYGAYTDNKSPHILLKKSEWHCTEVDTRTYMQPMTTGKTTMLMPIQDEVCVAYSRK